MPYVSTISPPNGPEVGGYIVTVIGRNMGFLDLDCIVMFGDAVGVKPTVVDPWDKIEVTAPVCKNCANTEIQVICNGMRSNKVPFTFENECYGPTRDGALKKLPELYSARENCTLCMDLVHLTMALAPDKAVAVAVVLVEVVVVVFQTQTELSLTAAALALLVRRRRREGRP